MYEYITTLQEATNNIVSLIYAIIIIGLATFHLIAPIVVFIWNALWCFLDDEKAIKANGYKKFLEGLDDTTGLKEEEYKGKYFVKLGESYLDKADRRFWSTCYSSSVFDREEAIILQKSCGGTVVRKDKDRATTSNQMSNYSFMWILLGLIALLYLPLNYFLTPTLYIGGAVALLFAARSCRRVQKKAVALKEQLDTHVADKEAHNGTTK